MTVFSKLVDGFVPLENGGISLSQREKILLYLFELRGLKSDLTIGFIHSELRVVLGRLAELGLTEEDLISIFREDMQQSIRDQIAERKMQEL